MADASTSLDEGGSPISLGIELLADRSSVLILRELFRGQRRYQEIRRRLQMSHAVIAERLRQLEASGVIRAERYSDHPPRFEYVLTEMGTDYWEVLLALWRWEALWLRPGKAVLPALAHASCGRPTLPWFGCHGCHQEVRFGDRLTIDADTKVLFEALAGTPNRYRRAGPGTSRSFSANSPDGVFSVLGDRWAALIILAFVKGLTRFSEIQRTLEISPALLTRRLDEFVRLEVIAPLAVPGRPYREYRLLDRGGDLRPALVLTHLWAMRWAGSERTDLLLHHGPDRHLMVPVWYCDVCREVIDPGALNAWRDGEWAPAGRGGVSAV